MKDMDAAAATGYSIARISILKNDPAFQELLKHYRDNVDLIYGDMHSRMASLGQDMVQELHQRLEEAPDSFTPALLLEGVKTLADRTGHAPINRSVSATINVDLSERLKAARERARAASAGEASVELVGDSTEALA